MLDFRRWLSGIRELKRCVLILVSQHMFSYHIQLQLFKMENNHFQLAQPEARWQHYYHYHCSMCVGVWMFVNHSSLLFSVCFYSANREKLSLQVKKCFLLGKNPPGPIFESRKKNWHRIIIASLHLLCTPSLPPIMGVFWRVQSHHFYANRMIERRCFTRQCWLISKLMHR